MKSNKKMIYSLLNMILIFFLVISYNTNFCMFQEKYQSKVDIQNEDNKSSTLLTNSWVINGVPICIAGDDQSTVQICNDKMGGAIIIWVHYSGVADIYAQKINSDGTTQWTANGVAICTASGDQWAPQICSDGTGGAIIVWEDSRGANRDIYAQRVNAMGVAQWTTDGVAICTASGDQWAPHIYNDGGSGAIITWYDYRAGDSNIYAQKISSSGSPQWTANGVAICTASGDQGSPQICRDGTGGAIIVWEDSRGANRNIYAQRVNIVGVAQWTTDGVAICTASGDQESLQIFNDSAGGAIIVWEDSRGVNSDIYAQKVSNSGSPQWTANGVAVCTAIGSQWAPESCSDGQGGVIIVWEDERSGFLNSDIYIQRINSAGINNWTSNGVALCTEIYSQEHPDICSVRAECSIITWTDKRSGSENIYIQKVASTGITKWAINGTALCTASGLQWYPQICDDGEGGAIVTWEDWRNYNFDVYAQRILSNGAIPIPPPIVGEADDDDDDNEKEDMEAIMGYDLSIITILSFGALIAIFFKIRKNLKNKLNNSDI